MVTVLVVEDSPVARELLLHILSGDAGIRVIGTASDGVAALEFLAHQQPDVITMDIHMPRLDGFETTRQIMETQPVPIVMVSASLNPGDLDLTFRALQAGAVDAVEKPHGIGHPDYPLQAAHLVRTVKAMSEVRVIKRWSRPRPATPASTPATQTALKSDVAAPSRPMPMVTAPVSSAVQAVVIGASTGGPPVVQTILAALPQNFSLPILIVQHIAAGFTQGMVEWLRQSTGFAVSLGAPGEILRPGHAYFAPDGCHMGVHKSGGEATARIALSTSAPENGLRPAVSYLFRSATGVFGPQVIGVLLTGMGKDGAEELRLMKAAGAVTLAQDEASSVVHGMPGEAIKLNAASYVMPPKRIAAMLESLALRRP